MSERRQSSPHRNLSFHFLPQPPQDLVEILLDLDAFHGEAGVGTDAVSRNLQAFLRTTGVAPGEKYLRCN